MRVEMTDTDHLMVKATGSEAWAHVKAPGGQAISFMTLESMCYIEVRKLEGQVRTFIFRRKSAKKYVDLGNGWDKAEVIFSHNAVDHGQ